MLTDDVPVGARVDIQYGDGSRVFYSDDYKTLFAKLAENPEIKVVCNDGRDFQDVAKTEITKISNANIPEEEKA